MRGSSGLGQLCSVLKDCHGFGLAVLAGLFPPLSSFTPGEFQRAGLDMSGSQQLFLTVSFVLVSCLSLFLTTKQL